MPEPRSGERGAEGFGIGHDGVASKVQRLTGALRRVGMARAAGILDHRNDSEIGGVARGRLDADFPRNAQRARRHRACATPCDGRRRPVIPGRAKREPQMCNCTSGNPWIPGSPLRGAPE